MPPRSRDKGPGRWIALVLVSGLMGVLVTGFVYWAQSRESFGRFAGRASGKALKRLGALPLPPGDEPPESAPVLPEDDSVRFEWRYDADVPEEQTSEQVVLAKSFAERVPRFAARFREVLDLTREYQFIAARTKLDALIADFGDDLPPEVNRAHELLLLTWGDRLLYEGRNAQAALILLELEGLHPTDRGFERLLGLAFYRAGDREKALPLFEAVYARVGDRAGINFELGELYYLRGELERARPLLESAYNGPNQQEVIRLLRKIDRESHVEGDFREIQGYDEGNFRISFDGTQNVRTAYGTRVILEQARKDIGRQFGFYPKDKISVVLYTRVQYNRALSAPNWSGALFDGKIRLPTKGLGSNALPLKNTIYHEYVHAVVVRMGGDHVPSWLHEGLAQYFEPDARSYRFSDYDISRSGVMALANLEHGFTGLPDRYVGTAYAQSQSFVGFLIQENGGMYRIKRVLGEMLQGKETHAALQAVYSMDRTALEDRWRRSLERTLQR